MDRLFEVLVAKRDELERKKPEEWACVINALRDKNWTYRQIQERLECSAGTVRKAILIGETAINTNPTKGV